MTASLRPDRARTNVLWRGESYDFVALLNATPLALADQATSMSWNAQSWWDCVVDLAPGQAAAIVTSVAQ